MNYSPYNYLTTTPVMERLVNDLDDTEPYEADGIRVGTNVRWLDEAGKVCEGQVWAANIHSRDKSWWIADGTQYFTVKESDLRVIGHALETDYDTLQDNVL